MTYEWAKHLCSWTDFSVFARDLFDIDVVCDVSASQLDVIEHQELVVALLCWRLTYTQPQNHMVLCPSQSLACYWLHLVGDALEKLPHYLIGKNIRSTRSEIRVGENRLFFYVANANSGRGQTITSMTIIEPSLIKPTTYRDLMQGIIPLMSLKGRHVIQYSRGY